MTGAVQSPGYFEIRQFLNTGVAAAGVTACAPKGIWALSRTNRRCRIHMAYRCAAAWYPSGASPRLGVLTRCRTYMYDAATAVEPPGDDFCDHCLLANQPGESAVYQFFDSDDQVLYVGFSGNMSVRADLHRSRAEWWPHASRVSYVDYPDEMTARRIERETIAQLQPPYNIDGVAGRKQKPRRLAA